MFVKKDQVRDFIPSGCTLLDCVLGGGYPVGRMANIVGDRSSGKTLLAIEACLNFLNKFKDRHVFYIESEAAFDFDYAESLGMNLDSKFFNFVDDVYTVEDLHEYLVKIVKNYLGSFVIIDSLDGLSDKAEMERDLDKGSYGTSKARLLSEIFRRNMQDISKTNTTLMIVSQVRDNIGVMFGEKKTRSGGKALDHYASQILWLAEIGKIKKTIKGINKITGINVKARCKKNKVAKGFRECEFPIVFGYGIDDVLSMVEYLFKAESMNREYIEELNGVCTIKKLTKTNYKTALASFTDDQYKQFQLDLAEIVPGIWEEIEDEFTPKRKKY